MNQPVETVTGPVDASKLGKTLVHEHFFFGYPGFHGDFTRGRFDWNEKRNQGIEVAERIMQHGVETVIDPTPNDCGRNPLLLREISEATGLQIICSTGYYYEGEGATPYFTFRQSLGTAEDEIHELFLTEVTEGIEGTGIKPGIIKLASSKGEITPYEKMFFRAGAKVQAQTGIPILTHTQEGTMGLEQVKLLLEHGADPSKLVIGHMCGTTDIHQHFEVLKQGVYVAFDRFGLQGIVGAPADEERMAVFLGLAALGYEKQLLLSHDTVNIWLGKEPILPESIAHLLRNWTPVHLFERIIPMMKEKGCPEEKLNKILNENPMHIFTGRKEEAEKNNQAGKAGLS
ncbi:phosphotriesterase [Thalassobacillus sp. C254]|uniref:phosphotriesterase family protein n=1 Tax=Thalassobacillus sp. C254 TaxID=1225341 RepID=UPI0006CFDAC3|nr:phosphotriesterase [Thalassobacillus sp. C254]